MKKSKYGLFLCVHLFIEICMSMLCTLNTDLNVEMKERGLRIVHWNMKHLYNTN